MFFIFVLLVGSGIVAGQCLTDTVRDMYSGNQEAAAMNAGYTLGTVLFFLVMLVLFAVYYARNLRRADMRLLEEQKKAAADK